MSRGPDKLLLISWVMLYIATEEKTRKTIVKIIEHQNNLDWMEVSEFILTQSENSIGINQSSFSLWGCLPIYGVDKPLRRILDFDVEYGKSSVHFHTLPKVQCVGYLPSTPSYGLDQGVRCLQGRVNPFNFLKGLILRGSRGSQEIDSPLIHLDLDRIFSSESCSRPSCERLIRIRVILF